MSVGDVPDLEAEALRYERAADEYQRALTLDHYMEAISAATQRSITLASFALVSAERPDIQMFNELLVQYPDATRPRGIQAVCPDNMVVLHPEPIRARKSYPIPLQPVPPFLVLEYVSEDSERKDYVDNVRRYEIDLRLPYYLIFHPERKEITLYHTNDEGPVLIERNLAGRYAIPELELEVGLHDDWMRYWFRGRLLPLPAELDRELREEREARRAERAEHEQTEMKLEEMYVALAEATEGRRESERQAAAAEASRAEHERRAAAAEDARAALAAEMEQMQAELARLRGTG